LTSEVWNRSVGVTGLYVLIGIVFVLKASNFAIRRSLFTSPEPQ
jgi:hypothetical protein